MGVESARPPGRASVGSPDRELAAPDRRRFLGLAASAPLLLAGAWSALACGGGSDEGPGSAAGAPAGGEGDAAEAPVPASGGSQPADAGSGTEDSTALVTEIASLEPTVQALQYTHESPKSDQQCANCQLYTPKTGRTGSCQLFVQGRVRAGGWCTSWVEKKQA